MAEGVEAALSVGSIDELGQPDLDTLLPHMALAAAADMDINFMSIVTGFIADLGDAPDALETGLRAAISAGFRAPPATIAWMLALDPDTAHGAGMQQIMADVLRADRGRYDAAKSAAP